MTRLSLILIFFISPIFYCQNLNLKFNAKGEFKILQLTDIHWSGDPNFTKKTEHTIRTLISKEKPDLIVLTGDNVNCDPMQRGWGELGGVLESCATPWTMVFGNHDGEHNLTNSQTFDFIKKFPHFTGEKGNVRGTGNLVLEISNKENLPGAYLFLLDSGDYTRNPKLGSYDWIHQNQIQWYIAESSRQKSKNGKIIPSLMFFHIPLQEYNEAKNDASAVGDKNEDVSSSDINSGMFAALLEQKNVMGTFCGHDHDNNFIGTTKEIALAYGNKTGNDGYGELEQGGRIIILKEGKFAFKTYIITPAATKYQYNYPAGLPEINADSEVLKSLNIAPKAPGLNFSYYEGNAEKVQDIAKMKFIKKGVASKIDLSQATAEDHFALNFNGFIKIPETGFYKFYTYSDDGSVLKIDGKTVVDNDGGHSAARREGVVALEKGFHKIEILYFEDYMGQILNVGFSSLEIPEQSLPEALLFR